MNKPEAWAIFNPATGRWTKVCGDCAHDLQPVWLPKLNRHGAWLNKTPVVLVPQRADDGLKRGDCCDLCPRHGRRAGWPYLFQAGIGVALILRAVFWMPSHPALHVVLAVAR